MAKRVKIDDIWLVIGLTGQVYGAGTDSASAWRDAGDRLDRHWKDLALSGSYALVAATANATYDPEELKRSFEGWKRIAAERYGKNVTL
ncbi:hypothetical protein [Salmonella enterica]|uniref:hypothetical protein n=1 Tax=Salmonella enterica TaxID=28901 RepID=UPI00061D3CE1|nr:hypothetical protein [Salmonella enterica]EFR5835238.1 hypothetical protein [Salmonella enterica]EGO1490811.1 hypothetical protein [Salmonella enterica]KKE16890.1 hypothetical protein TJ54_11420 [Salmonella enterica subsp. enterica serovar Kentucky]TAO08534.1 hypothetical protein EYR92_15665 [Salmonella enterica subsp. enterica serovar Kentucky]TAO19671.1 hypothetical protein EYS18_01720 [Salmonella enterica subsp. enterica serovar Kentucky]